MIKGDNRMTKEPSYAKLLGTVREAGGDVQTMAAFAECVITAYKAALEQEQEPVRWWDEERDAMYRFCTHEIADYHNFKRAVPLYAHRPRTWVGLTDDEAKWLYKNYRTPSDLIDMVEAKLKEKNA